MIEDVELGQRREVRAIWAGHIRRTTTKHGPRRHPNALRSHTAANYPLEFTTARERFLARFDEHHSDFAREQRPRVNGECILWPGQVANTGYGKLRLVAQPDLHILTHVLAARMFLLGSEVIPEGEQVNHTCDVRLCCNYRHLYLGDHLMNMSDLRHRGSFTRQLQIERSF